MQLKPFGHFSEIEASAPDMEAVKADYQQLMADLEGANSDAARQEVIQRWDKVQREHSTWGALAYLKFSQDTTNEGYVKERELADELSPQFKDLNTQVQKKLLSDKHREAVQASLGDQALALWRCEIATFAPEIQEDLIREAKLGAEYTALKASAKVEFRGESHSLPKMGKFLTDADRETRHEASRAYWAWFEENAAQIDRIYDDLVKLRHQIARKLGFQDFIELGYTRMQRIDYDKNDVENFRAQVREHLVPLVSKLRQRQRQELGVEALMWWDQDMHGAGGNPEPQGDLDWIVAQTQEVFDQLHPALAQFYQMMRQRDLMDLPSREGKAGGGFCTWFGTYGSPYIFANFNGTQGDVRVLIHELGHAFQAWSSRHLEPIDVVWPTYEACEIHSMGLEHLTYSQMHHLFGEDAARYRRIHLTEALTFIPYGVAVDHFQHLVYEKPEATPAERRQMWQQVEQMYLPWMDAGDLAHLQEGGLWHRQAHIFGMPFYYIDYTLAETCALQYWAWSQKDLEEALDSYVKLCGRGGSQPFQALARSAGLTSPFDQGCLTDIIQTARQALEI